jgi:hypothetical protein
VCSRLRYARAIPSLRRSRGRRTRTRRTSSRICCSRDLCMPYSLLRNIGRYRKLPRICNRPRDYYQPLIRCRTRHSFQSRRPYGLCLEGSSCHDHTDRTGLDDCSAGPGPALPVNLCASPLRGLRPQCGPPFRVVRSKCLANGGPDPPRLCRCRNRTAVGKELSCFWDRPGTSPTLAQGGWQKMAENGSNKSESCRTALLAGFIGAASMGESGDKRPKSCRSDQASQQTAAMTSPGS